MSYIRRNYPYYPIPYPFDYSIHLFWFPAQIVQDFFCKFSQKYVNRAIGMLTFIFGIAHIFSGVPFLRFNALMLSKSTWEISSLSTHKMQVLQSKYSYYLRIFVSGLQYWLK